jgi:hypothetical protein
MKNHKYVLPFIILAIATSISSCTANFNSTSRNIETEIPQPTTTPTTPPPTPTPTSETPTEQTANVTLYTSDLQCQELIPQTTSVPTTEPIISAVGKIIEQQQTADFELSGYRVQVENGIATVDFRLSPSSQRQFTSLSSCEQFALFASLRKTLISNTEWNIKEVRFTEQGEEIIL